MQVSGIFQGLGEERVGQLLRSISIGKLKTYQLYEVLKTRLRAPKLNSEALKKAAPIAWGRLQAGEQDFATELAQAVLVSHLDMVVDVLGVMGIPNEDGFFAKDLDASTYLTDGWQQRVYDQFKSKYPDALLVFYINHLAVEVQHAEQLYLPSA